MDNASNKSNGAKITIIVLTLLLAVLAFFVYKIHLDNKESEALLLEEKLSIQSDLDNKIVELENAIATNSSLTNELTEARDNIISFRDSVKSLKTLNYRIIRRYKEKLAVVESSNKELMNKVASLKIENFNLSVERDSAQAVVERQITTITEKNQENEDLVNKNNDLSKKINKGSALQIGKINVVAMKERRHGKLKETKRARRTDAFRISFNIRKNSIAQAGKRKAHIVIKDASGKVLSSTNTFTGANGATIQYTDSTDIDYKNEDIEVIAVTSLSEERLEKGEYYISVYLEHVLLGNTSIYLK